MIRVSNRELDQVMYETNRYQPITKLMFTQFAVYTSLGLTIQHFLSAIIGCGDNFHIASSLWGKSTGHQWISPTKG